MKIFNLHLGRLHTGFYLFQDYPVCHFYFHPFQYMFGIDFATTKIIQFYCLIDIENYKVLTQQEINEEIF